MKLLFTTLLVAGMVMLKAQNTTQVTNIINTCAGQNNGSVVLKITTNQNGPYSFSVTGSAFSYTNSSLISKKDSIIGLGVGTYTYRTSDGVSIYTGNFNINTISIPIQASLQNSVICSGGSNALSVTCNGLPSNTCNQYASASQTFVAIGNDTIKNTLAGWPCLYGNWYKNTRHQILINASELTAQGYTQGLIKSVGLKVFGFGAPVGALPNFTIKMKAVSLFSLSLSSFDNVGFTQVYTSSGTYVPVVGLNTHHLQTYFYWNGTSDLLIDFCYSLITQNPYTINPFMESSVTPVNKLAMQYSDITSLCSTTMAPSMLTFRRPNVLLGIDASPAVNTLTYSWQPTTFLNNAFLANPSVSNATAALIYTVTANTINNCTSSSTVNLLVSGCNSIQEQAGTFNLVVYPNPVTNTLYIRSDKPFTQVELYNIAGQRLYQLATAYLTESTILMEHVSAGLYFLKVKDDLGHESIQKINVVR